MARTYTKDQLESMTGEAKRFALEIDAMEAELEERQKPAEVPPAQPENQQATEPPAQETQQSTEEKPDHQVQDTPQEPSLKDLDYWKKKADESAKEAETAEKRRRDAESHLTPIQQEAAALRKENSALEAKIQELHAKFDSLSAKIQERPDASTQESDDYLSNEFPDVSAAMNLRLQKLKQELRMEAVREAQEAIRKDLVSQEDFRTLKAQMEAEQDAAEARSHYLGVQTVHKDAGMFFDETALRPAFIEWAKTQSPEFEKAVNYPRSFTPRFVASVITAFKRDSGLLRSTETPSLGDRVAKATPAPNVQVEKPKEDEYLTDDQLACFDELQRKYRHDPLMQGKLIEMLERTLKRNFNRR